MSHVPARIKLISRTLFHLFRCHRKKFESALDQSEGLIFCKIAVMDEAINAFRHCCSCVICKCCATDMTCCHAANKNSFLRVPKAASSNFIANPSTKLDSYADRRVPSILLSRRAANCSPLPSSRVGLSDALLSGSSVKLSLHGEAASNNR